MARKQTNHEYPLSYVAKEMQNILAEFVSDYADEVEGKAAEITQQVATDFASLLGPATPRSTKVDEHLADTVKLTKSTSKYYGKKTTAYVVHYGKWQIAHLLEFGWTSKNGEHVVRQPFIRPLFDRNRDRYVKMYKDGLKR